MFTGIVAGTGTVDRIRRQGADLRMRILAPSLELGRIRPGDSIAVSGVCLTATAVDGTGFDVDVSPETLEHTTLGELVHGSRVNLEPALTLEQPLGGHLVSGHVDGIGRVRSITEEGRYRRIGFALPARLLRYVCRKGSVTVDGVSLTVAGLGGEGFEVQLIPHTLERTILKDYHAGSQVNIEVDLIARYLERLLQFLPAGGEGVTLEGMRRAGFGMREEE
ncbi:MAG: riboflavin synthase [Gammaproteobacteria bacterium]|nr:MAG: riboflavin synthase [Gammaproteobacteria bacterium]